MWMKEMDILVRMTTLDMLDADFEKQMNNEYTERKLVREAQILVVGTFLIAS